MMTKTTTQTKAILKQTALLPIFVMLFYGISFKTVAMENPPSHSIQTKSPDSKNKFTKKNTVLEKGLIDKTTVVKSLASTNDTGSNILTDSIATKTDPIIETTLPQFPGGVDAFYKFIAENFKISTEFKGSGKVFLTFMVEKDGSLSEFEILKDIGFGTGEEVIRVLKLSPKWIPGKENNEAIRVKYSLPIYIDPSK